MKNLQEKGGRYYFRVTVPKDIRNRIDTFNLSPELREKFSRILIEEACDTDSKDEAVAFRNRKLGELQTQWRSLLKGNAISRDALARMQHATFTDGLTMARNPYISQDVRQLAIDFAMESAGAPDELIAEILVEADEAPTPENIRLLRAVRTKALTAARSFNPATDSIPSPPAIRTPLAGDGSHVAAWLAAPSARKKRPKAARTKEEAKHALALLGKFLGTKTPHVVEAVTPIVASQFADWLENTAIADKEGKDTGKFRSPVTCNKSLTLISSYMKYCVRPLGIIKENPFTGVWRAVGDQVQSAQRRGFTALELEKLFTDAPDDIAIPCAVGLLLGARREDLMRLTPADLVNGSIRIAGAKTNREYYVPLHPLLKPIIAKLAKGRGQNDSLLDAPKKRTNDARPLGDTFGKRFSRLKQKMFGDSAPLAFHSLRHSLAEMLEASNAPEAVVSRILNHAGGIGFTFSTYSKGDNETMRAALEAITLPKGVVARLKKLVK